MSRLVGKGVQSSRMARAITTQENMTATGTSFPANPINNQTYIDPNTNTQYFWSEPTKQWISLSSVYLQLDRYAVTLAADASGTVGDYSDAYTIVRFYVGDEEQSLAVADITITDNNTTTSATKTGAGNGVKVSVSALSADQGSVTLEYLFNNSTYSATFSLAKAKAGVDSVVMTLDKEAVTIQTDVYGLNGDFTDAYTIVRLWDANTEVDISGETLTLTDTNTTSAQDAEPAGNGRRVTVSALSDDDGNVKIEYTYNTVLYTKYFTLSKSRTGGGNVYRGPFDEDTEYNNNSLQRDIVYYDDSGVSGNIGYWMYKGTDGANGTWAAANWEFLNETFSAVATEILLAEDATITKTLIIGSDVTYGLIKSANYVPGTTGWAIQYDGTAEFSSATMGGWTITGDSITGSTAGVIKAGQTDYATGTGFFLGYHSGKYKFSIGDATDYFLYNGESVKMRGSVTHNSPELLKSYATASLPVTTTTTAYASPDTNSTSTEYGRSEWYGDSDVDRFEDSCNDGTNIYCVGRSDSEGIILYKFNSSLTLQARKYLGTAAADYVPSITYDGSNLFVVFRNYTTENKIAIIKLDTSLNLVAQMQVNGDNLTPYDVINDAGSYIYILGKNTSGTTTQACVMKVPVDLSTITAQVDLDLGAGGDEALGNAVLVGSDIYAVGYSATYGSDTNLLLIAKITTSLTLTDAEHIASVVNNNTETVDITYDGSTYLYVCCRKPTTQDTLFFKFNTSLAIQAQALYSGTPTDLPIYDLDYTGGKLYACGYNGANSAGQFLEINTDLSISEEKLITKDADIVFRSMTIMGGDWYMSGRFNQTGSANNNQALVFKLDAIPSSDQVSSPTGFEISDSSITTSTPTYSVTGPSRAVSATSFTRDTATLTSGSSTLTASSLYKIGKYEWSNPGNVYASDDTYATNTDPSTGVVKVALSKDSGSNFSPFASDTFTGVEGSNVYGSSSDTWGYTWSGSEAKNNMVVRISTEDETDYIDLSGMVFAIGDTVIINGIEVSVEAKWDGATLSVDHVQVRVTYGNTDLEIASGAFTYVSDGAADGNGTVAVYDVSGWRECILDKDLASQAQAEAGAATDVWMSPLRTAQAIAALESGADFHAEFWQKTGISATGNQDQTITTNFEAKGIVVFVSSSVPGSNIHECQKMMVFDASTFKYSWGFEGLHTAGIADLGDIAAVWDFDSSTGYQFDSSGADQWTVQVSIQSLGSTSFVVRAACTKANSPANLDIDFAVQAWG